MLIRNVRFIKSALILDVWRLVFFFSSRRRHTRSLCDWSSDVCSSDLERTRRELRQLIKRVGITTVFVTHEQEEAFELGDRVAVLNAGRLEQAGAPDELYERPASLFVAAFVGRANVFRGAAARALSGADGVVVVRPEQLLFAAAGLAGVVRERRYTGAAAFYLLESDSGERFEVMAAPDAAHVGDRVFVQAERVLRFAENGR